MKPFLVLRVPIILNEDKTPARRPRYAGPGSTIVAEAETEKEAAEHVKEMGWGDRLHHYYAFELIYSGDPERKGVKVERPKEKKARPKLAVVGTTERKKA